MSRQNSTNSCTGNSHQETMIKDTATHYSTYFLPRAMRPYSTPHRKISPEPRNMDTEKHIVKGGMARL
ncbi:hypothetical protein E2C01_079111 [Portunus trituberculatus]|uniref:Uncharacterized protein n=1 Tax=Portunus trituberculatus TaxID=210409 RepID=A0A5B7IPR9_PORTR|nr:hypothetical protein [Portunus trituberculatus]